MDWALNRGLQDANLCCIDALWCWWRGLDGVWCRLDTVEHNLTQTTACMQVRGSAISAKRLFLEKKGLTAAEIDEAVKRVPETTAVPAPAATAATTTSTPTYGANNLVTYTQQSPATGQHTVPASTHQSVASGPGAGALAPMHPQQQMQPIQPVQQPIRWTQVGHLNIPTCCISSSYCTGHTAYLLITHCVSTHSRSALLAQ